MACKFEHVIVWNIEGTGPFHHPPVIVIDLVLRENDNPAERRAADQPEEVLDIELIEVAPSKSPDGQPNMLEHEGREWLMPAFDAQPTTAAAKAIADNVHVHVDRLHRAGQWHP